MGSVDNNLSPTIKEIAWGIKVKVAIVEQCLEEDSHSKHNTEHQQKMKYMQAKVMLERTFDLTSRR